MLSVRKRDLDVVDKEEAVERLDEERDHDPADDEDDETNVVRCIGSLRTVSQVLLEASKGTDLPEARYS